MSPSSGYGGTVPAEGFDRPLGASYQLEELIGRGSTTGLVDTPEYLTGEAGDALNTFNDRLISAGRVQ